MCSLKGKTLTCACVVLFVRWRCTHTHARIRTLAGKDSALFDQPLPSLWYCSASDTLLSLILCLLFTWPLLRPCDCLAFPCCGFCLTFRVSVIKRAQTSHVQMFFTFCCRHSFSKPRGCRTWCFVVLLCFPLFCARTPECVRLHRNTCTASEARAEHMA